jgi:predicted O-methyltransferase YrrM
MTDASTIAKRGYVGAMRVVREVVRPTGLLDRPAPKREDRTKHWLRSLTAIHDVDALIALDVPWWTYDAIDQVEQFLGERGNARVFEYGSGASTVWLAKRSAHVTSVEHEAGWCDILRPRLADFDNITLNVVASDATPDADTAFHSVKPGYRGTSFRAYVEAIRDADGPFDLIVIDGRARPACLAEAVNHLADGGMIVFDNSHRAPYRAAIAAADVDATVLRGMVPSLPAPDETSLLRKRG